MRTLAAAAVALILSTPARAELSACYDITWLGFPLAEVVYEEKAAGTTVHTEFVVESVGLVHVFGPFRYAATADTGAEDGTLQPLGYTAKDGPDPRSRRIIDLRFDPETGAVDEVITPPRDETKVEPKLRVGAIDPLTAFVATRHAVRDAAERGAGGLRLPIYDGSKRYDIEVTFTGREPLAGQGEAVKAEVHLHPVAGFDDPKAGTDGPAEVWFAPGRDFMPVRVSTGGPGAVTLADFKEGRACRF